MTAAAPHWTSAWIGRPWIAGERECLDLVLDVLARRFRADMTAEEIPDGARARDRALADALARRTVPVADGAEAEGDIAWMRPLGRRVGGHHLGIGAATADGVAILHACERAGTVLSQPRDLHWLGLELLGWRRPTAPAGGERARLAAPAGLADAPPALRSVRVEELPHPLDDAGALAFGIAEGPTLAEIAAACRTFADGEEVVACVNGEAVLAAAWETTRPKAGDRVTLRAAAAGGNALRTVLSLAVIAASIYAPYAGAGLNIGGLVTTTGGVTATGALVSAGVMASGGLLLNALAPPRIETPSLATGPARADPTHSISSGQNAARPWQALALTLGTVRAAPDAIGQPWTEFDGEGRQTLRQIFDFGLGDLEVADLKIGDTPLDDFDDAATTWLEPGEAAPFTGDVDTIAGGALEWDADPAERWVTRRTSAGTVRIGVDVAGRLFRANDDGSIGRERVGLDVEYRAVGASAWTAAPTAALSHADQAPLRRSLAYDVDEGQYDVRVRRRSRAPSSSRRYAELEWTALRSYVADRGDVAGRKRLLLAIRASGQISGRIDRLTALVSQKVPAWEGGAWTAAKATGNPAWIFRAFALGWTWGGRLAAGAGIEAAAIDDAQLRAWGAFCAAQGLECHRAVRPGETALRTLETIARCGRATLDWSGGKLGVVWDAAGRAPATLLTPADVTAGSYRTEWTGERLPGEIVGRYVDRDAGWETREARRAVRADADAGASVSIELDGVTTRAQALAEVSLEAAASLRRRRRHSWVQPAGAQPAGRGQVLSVAHSLVDGGLTGRTLRLSRTGEHTVSWTGPLRLGSGDGALFGNSVGEWSAQPGPSLPGSWFDPAVDGDVKVSRLRFRGASDRVPGRIDLSLGPAPLGGEGPQLRADVAARMSIRAVVGDDAVEIPGPAAAASAAPDPTEPYAWFPSAETQAAVAAWNGRRTRHEPATLEFFWSGGDADGAVLSSPVTLGSDDDRLILTLPDGSLHRTAASAATPGETTTADVRFAAPIPVSALPPDQDPLDLHWRFLGAAGEPAAVTIVAIRSAGPGLLRYDAVDYDERYYAAADLPEDGTPAPAPRTRTPRVLGGVWTERLVRAGAGYAVELSLALETTGDWRGGTVWAGVDGGAKRIAARLADGETEAVWLAPTSGLAEAEVVPGSAGAPVGPRWSGSHRIVGSLAPPGPPTNFLVEGLADGTRRFRWTPPADADFAGIAIRYAETGARAPAWADMTPLSTGLLTASPWETIAPEAGRWTFAARAYDVGGRESEDDARIDAELGPERQGPTLLFRTPSALDWPGTIIGLERDGAPENRLEAPPDETWAALEGFSWAQLEARAMGLGGDGASGARAASYADEALDLGVSTTFGLTHSEAAGGTVTFQARAGATKAACEAAAWTDVAAGTSLTGRWVQPRWSLAGDGATLLWLDRVAWSVLAPETERRLLGISTSDLPAAPGGGWTIPASRHGLARVIDVDAILVGFTGAGSLTPAVDLSAPTAPILRLYTASGAVSSAAATLNVTLRGLP